jgi:hypothetical protein
MAFAPFNPVTIRRELQASMDRYRRIQREFEKTRTESRLALTSSYEILNRAERSPKGNNSPPP